MHQCKPNAHGSILSHVQRPSTKEACSFQHGDQNLHYKGCEDYRYVPLLLGSPREQTITKSHVFVAKENGSVLLSCRTTKEMGLIKPRVHLDYLPPKARLLTSTCDQPSKTKFYKHVHCTKETNNASMVPQKSNNNITNIAKQLVTRQEHIMAQYSDIFEGVGKFPREPYKIRLDPKIPPKQTPCWPVPLHLKHAFKAEIDKMLKAGVLKPVQEATPWINSFI